MEKKANVLKSCLGKPQTLISIIGYEPDAIVSKTILDKPVGTITLFAFSIGQRINEHTSPYDAVVQVLDGTAKIIIGGVDTHVNAGQVIVMPANTPHAVEAGENFKMLLIMIRQ